MPLDLSVYLVTDSKLNHASRTLVQTVSDAIDGGVTIVQLREKSIDTKDFISLGKQVHAVCKQKGVPLLINDRIDVALAVGCEGVHLGQDDTSLLEARKLLGNKIIGISTGTVDEAVRAIQDGADYIGIGTCFQTQTKNPKRLLGPSGVREILSKLPSSAKTVVIGGIKHHNTKRVIVGSATESKHLDGVAVVTDIVSAVDAKLAAQQLTKSVQSAFETLQIKQEKKQMTASDVAQYLTTLRQKVPLVQNITNYVVMNDTANITLAIGGSPIMAHHPDEAQDLASFIGALVLNYGTLGQTTVQEMITSGAFCNQNNVPVVLDPVGAGATTLRRTAMRDILDGIQVSVIKGNAGEIAAVGKIAHEMKGVDSEALEIKKSAQICKLVAKQEKAIVCMTGKVDVVSDGTTTVLIENGHEWMGKITGSGCMATSVIGAFAGLRQDLLISTVSAMVCVGIAGELAAQRSDVKGPGTFKSAFIDQVYLLTPEIIKEKARFKVIETD